MGFQQSLRQRVTWPKAAKLSTGFLSVGSSSVEGLKLVSPEPEDVPSA